MRFRHVNREDVGYVLVFEKDITSYRIARKDTLQLLFTLAIP